MQRRHFLKTGTLVATAGIAALAGCSDTGDNQQQTDNGSKTPTDTETTLAETAGTGRQKPIQMVTEGGEYYFDPIGLYVESGKVVTWEIGSGSHSSTAYKEGNSSASVTRIPDDAEAWDSGILSEQGATFEYTFETPGTYDYFCIPHKSLGMVGRIIVDEPGGPAEGSMPPDGEVPDSQTIVDQGIVSYSDFTG